MNAMDTRIVTYMCQQGIVLVLWSIRQWCNWMSIWRFDLGPIWPVTFTSRFKAYQRYSGNLKLDPRRISMDILAWTDEDTVRNFFGILISTRLHRYLRLSNPQLMPATIPIQFDIQQQSINHWYTDSLTIVKWHLECLEKKKLHGHLWLINVAGKLDYQCISDWLIVVECQIVLE
jgi:hypothetical protein